MLPLPAQRSKHQLMPAARRKTALSCSSRCKLSRSIANMRRCGLHLLPVLQSTAASAHPAAFHTLTAIGRHILLTAAGLLISAPGRNDRAAFAVLHLRACQASGRLCLFLLPCSYQERQMTHLLL